MIVAALSLAKEVLLPLALAVLLSFLLTPLANRLERRLGLPRVPAVLGVALFSFTVMGVLIWIVWMQTIDLSYKLETYQGNIVAKVRSISNGSGPIGKVAETIEKMGKEISGNAGPATKEPKQPEPLGPNETGTSPLKAAATDGEPAALPAISIGRSARMQSAFGAGHHWWPHPINRLAGLTAPDWCGA